MRDVTIDNQKQINRPDSVELTRDCLTMSDLLNSKESVTQARHGVTPLGCLAAPRSSIISSWARNIVARIQLTWVATRRHYRGLDCVEVVLAGKTCDLGFLFTKEVSQWCSYKKSNYTLTRTQPCGL